MSELFLEERSYQRLFYDRLKAAGFRDEIRIERSTDGFTNYILFEQKQNVMSNGKKKTLGQVIKYLVRLNQDGIPVPGTIALVSQEEEKVYLYSASTFASLINDIPRFISGRASSSVNSFEIPDRYADTEKIVSYHIDINDKSNDNMTELVQILKSKRSNVKVNITIDNVVGWARYYYDNCRREMKKKECMFRELRNPLSVLGSYIYPWTGKNEDFGSRMDQLNDMELQKITGAYYTPEVYCQIATNMLLRRVNEFKEKYPDDDYLIIDRCAGTGNMELTFEDAVDSKGDTLLSHFIVNTLEYQEWIALYNRLGSQVRVIIPNNESPDRDGQLIKGSDATSEEFNNTLKRIISEVKRTEHCGIFIYENPPYVQTGTRNVQGASFRDSYISKMMRDNDAGKFTNDLFNQFVWSGFNLMENEDDCYILIGPLKPWKNNGFIDREVAEAYLTNRKHYHTSGATANPIVCYRNKHSDAKSILFTEAVDIINGCPEVVAENILVKKSYKNLSETMYDKRKIEKQDSVVVCKNGDENLEGRNTTFNSTTFDNVVGFMDSTSYELENPGNTTKLTIAAQYNGHGCYLFKNRASNVVSNNGILVNKAGNENLEGINTRRVNPIYNEDIIGYLNSNSFELENPGNTTMLTIGAQYNGNGCYLWDDDWVTRIPAFSAGFYKDITGKWYDSIFSKSGDGAERYFADVKVGILNDWLVKNMIWVCMTRNAKMYSLNGSDGRKYINQLCFGQGTLADEVLEKAQSYGFNFTEQERELFDCWNRILTQVKETPEYAEHEADGFTYGTHMIVQEICKEYTEINADGEEVRLRKNSDIFENVRAFEKKLDAYYIAEIAPVLKQYEFIK